MNNNNTNINHATLNLYNIFLTVAQTMNLSAASKRLFISQPAISKAIKQLENELSAEIRADIRINKRAIQMDDS